MQEPKRVAILIEKQVGYCERVINGIVRYANETAQWVYRGSEPAMAHVRAVPRWRPHGVIAALYDEAVADEIDRFGVPVIDVFNWLDHPCTARIAVDEFAIGRLAAEHFAERGLRHFAFTGELKYAFIRHRLAGFVEALAEAGRPAPSEHALEFGNSSWGFHHLGADVPLTEWITSMPKPVGIMTGNDDAGLRVLEAARRLKIRVPDDVAVLGVDNNVVLCNLAHPPLSSIEIGPERIGFEAARSLDIAMRGEPVPPRTLVMPVQVVERQSTDTLAIDDPEVAGVVRAIRRGATGKLNVPMLLKDLPVRRRTLERRFRALVGHSIHDEIRNARIARARTLLAESDLSMPAIAQRCGFGNAERLSRVFREILSMTPTAFRRQFRATE